MKFRLVEDNVIGINDPEVDEVIDELPPKEEKEVEHMIDVLEDKLNFTPIADNHKLYNALDRCLEVAMEGIIYGKPAKSGANLLVVGRAGTGKSEIINRWAEHRNINLVSKSASSFEKGDVRGVVTVMVDDDGKPLNKVTQLTNSEFDSLDEPGSVLFLDELNRADPEVIGTLLTLMLDHKLPDSSEQRSMKTFKGFLFSVAAINPADGNYDTNKLDPAVMGRFITFDMGEADVPGYREHVVKQWEDAVKKAEAEYQRRPTPRSEKAVISAKGRLGICKALLASPLFSFDTPDEEAEAFEKDEHTTSPRNLSAALTHCDGTKESFLDVFPRACNPDKLDTVEQILTDYVDVVDKANDALKYKDGFLPDEAEEESIFGKDSAWDILQAAM